MPSLVEIEQTRQALKSFITRPGGVSDADIVDFLASRNVTIEEIKSLGGPNVLTPGGAARTNAQQGAGIDQAAELRSLTDAGLGAVPSPSRDIGRFSGNIPRINPDAARLAGGMAAGVLGQAGPQAMFPEELITIPLGAELAGQGAELFNQFVAGEEFTESPAKRAERAAKNIAIDMSLAGVGGLIEKGIKSIPAHIASILKSPKSRMEEVRRFEGLGIPLDAGAISGNKTVQGLQNILGKLPGSANVVAEGFDNVRIAAGEAMDRIIGRAGVPLTVQEAGNRLVTGIKGHVKRFSEKFDVRYAGLNKFIDKAEQVPIENTVGFLSKELGDFAGLPNVQKAVVPAELRGFLNDFNKLNGVITWHQLQSFRSYVGRQSRTTNLVSGIPKATWKQLYGNLTEDMRRALASKGDDAIKTFDSVNLAYAKGIEEIKKVLDPLINSRNVETAFKAAFTGSKEGASRLQVIKKNLKPDEFRDLVDAKLHLMGRPPAGVGLELEREFNPISYFNNYRALPPETKKILFGLDTPLRESLDELALASSAIKSVQGMANPSGTAGGLGFFFTLSNLGAGTVAGALTTGSPAGAAAGAAIGAASTGVTIATNIAAAKLLKNPRFVKWLAQGVKIPTTNFNSIATHIARLPGIINSEPEIADEVAQYIDALGGAPAKDRRSATIQSTTGSAA